MSGGPFAKEDDPTLEEGPALEHALAEVRVLEGVPPSLWPLIAAAYKAGRLYLQEVSDEVHAACEGQGCAFCDRGLRPKVQLIALGPKRKVCR